MAKEPKLLGAAEFKADLQRRFETYECPFKPGFALRCRSLTEREMAKYEMDTLTSKGTIKKSRLATAKRRLIALVAVNESDETFLTNTDVDAMANADSRLIQWAATVCQEHIGLDEEDLETTVKNSEEITVEE